MISEISSIKWHVLKLSCHKCKYYVRPGCMRLPGLRWDAGNKSTPCDFFKRGKFKVIDMPLDDILFKE